MWPTIWTVGHCIRPIDELLTVLAAYDIELVVDVRRFPGSKRLPQFSAEALTDAHALRTAIMCAELLWWRCHRRIIAAQDLAAHASGAPGSRTARGGLPEGTSAPSMGSSGVTALSAVGPSSMRPRASCRNE